MARDRRIGGDGVLHPTGLDALAALQDAFCDEAEAPEQGYLTTKQWAAAWGKSEPRAGAILSRAHALGKVERRMYRVRVSNRTIPVPHYRVLS